MSPTAAQAVHSPASTIGLSPKVWQPIVGQILLLLVPTAIVTGGLSREVLAEVAVIILTLGLGFRAPAGRVVLATGEGEPVV